MGVTELRLVTDDQTRLGEQPLPVLGGVLVVHGE
jgi:hypothetical protein